MDLTRANKLRTTSGTGMSIPKSPETVNSRYRRYRDAYQAGVQALDNLFIRHQISENKRQEVLSIKPGMVYKQAKQYFRSQQRNEYDSRNMRAENLQQMQPIMNLGLAQQ